MWTAPDYLRRISWKEVPMKISFKDFYVGQNKPEFLAEIKKHNRFVLEQNLMVNLINNDNEIRIDFSTFSKSDRIKEELPKLAELTESESEESGSSFQNGIVFTQKSEKKLSNFSLFCNMEQSSNHFAESLNRTFFDREQNSGKKQPRDRKNFKSKSIFKKRESMEPPKRKNLSIFLKRNPENQLLDKKSQKENLQESEYLRDPNFMSEHSPERRNSAQELEEPVFKKEMFQVKSLRNFGGKKSKRKQRMHRLPGMRGFWPKKISNRRKSEMGKLVRWVGQKQAKFIKPKRLNIFESEIFKKNKFISLSNNNMNHFYYNKRRRKTQLENVHSMPDNHFPSFLDFHRQKEKKRQTTVASNCSGQNSEFRDDHSQNSLAVRKVEIGPELTEGDKAKHGNQEKGQRIQK